MAFKKKKKEQTTYAHKPHMNITDMVSKKKEKSDQK